MSNLDSMVRTTVSFIGNATNSARAAIADESESNVRYYTQQIVGLSAQADSIVKGM